MFWTLRTGATILRMAWTRSVPPPALWCRARVGFSCLNYLRRMKVAIVTGAAQGIGRRTAEVLAIAGYTLALLDLKSSEATLAQARAAGAEAEEFLGDVSDEKFVAKAVQV